MSLRKNLVSRLVTELLASKLFQADNTVQLYRKWISKCATCQLPGETWLVMVRRAGDADRDNRTEGLGVRNSSWITGISLLLWRIV